MRCFAIGCLDFFGFVDTEERGDRFVVVDALDAFTEELCDAKSGDGKSFAVADGHAIGGDEFGDGGLIKAFDCEVGENRVRDASDNAGGATFFEDFCGAAESARGFCEIVDEDNISAFDFADDVECLNFGGAFSAFSDDRKGCVEGLRVGGSHFKSADIWGDDHGVNDAFSTQVANDDRGGEKVVDGDVKKACNLLRVKVHGEDAIDTGGGEKIGVEFGGDGDARLIFAILASVTKERNDGGDSCGACPTSGVDHDE